MTECLELQQQTIALMAILKWSGKINEFNEVFVLVGRERVDYWGCIVHLGVAAALLATTVATRLQYLLLTAYCTLITKVVTGRK